MFGKRGGINFSLEVVFLVSCCNEEFESGLRKFGVAIKLVLECLERLGEKLMYLNVEYSLLFVQFSVSSFYYFFVHFGALFF